MPSKTTKTPAAAAPYTDRKPSRTKNKRAEENKAIRREALREELQAREYLRQLESIDKEFGEINETVKNLKTPTAQQTKANALVTGNNFGRELARADTRIKALKERATLNFKRLNKVLPDLKAVELSDPEGKNPFGNLLEAMRLSISNKEDEE